MSNDQIDDNISGDNLFVLVTADQQEADFIKGSRQAWTQMLQLCLKNLGYTGDESEHLEWIEERESAIAALRTICESHGDNEWPDDLHLADILDKHLKDYLP